jgi:hypothetical protein
MFLDRLDKLGSVKTHRENNCLETLSWCKFFDSLSSDIGGKLKIRAEPVDKKVQVVGSLRRLLAADFPPVACG